MLNKSKEKPQSLAANFDIVRRFLNGSKRLFALSIASALLTTFADMIDPQIVRMAVDNAIGGKEPNYSPFVMRIVNYFGGFEYLGKHIWIMALAVVLVALIRVGAQYCFRVSNTRATETFVKSMRDGLFAHIEHLPFSWHMSNHTGDIIQRCTSDINTMRNFIAEQLTAVFRILILLTLSLIFMLSMNLKLTLIALIPMPLILIYSLSFYEKIGEGFLKCDEAEGKLSAMVQENLTGVRVVRAFAQERSERERFEAQNEYYTGLWMKLAKILSRYWSSQDILSGTQILLVVVFGALFCIRGEMSPGEYIAFMSYNGMLTWPLRMLGRMLSEMSKAGVSLERIAYILNSELEKEEGAALCPELRGDIVFDNVSFAYDNGPEILRNVSFTMKAGSTLGILGGTGSGKSTLMLLLDKLYPLPEGKGRISIGGVDIRDIDISHLRRNIGIVLQEPFLFSRSIAENIGISTAVPAMEDIRGAARAACLDDTVMSFAKGYDTFVGERGVTLSGGQKQRAAIARALICDSPILIFDDSLSAVDTETDALIRASLEKRFGTASIILISHRISTLSKADLILVMDGGELVQSGTHEELIAQEGIYRLIYEIQSGNAEEAAV